MQISHGSQTTPGISTIGSNYWHTSPSSCFQCHGFTKQVVLINFHLEKWAETKSNTCKSLSQSISCCLRFFSMLCFVNHKKDVRCAEIPQRLNQNCLLSVTHLFLSLDSQVRKWFIFTQLTYLCIWPKGEKNNNNYIVFSWRMEFRLPRFWLISAMRRMSEYDDRDKNGTWRMCFTARSCTSEVNVMLEWANTHTQHCNRYSCAELH